MNNWEIFVEMYALFMKCLDRNCVTTLCRYIWKFTSSEIENFLVPMYIIKLIYIENIHGKKYEYIYTKM